MKRVISVVLVLILVITMLGVLTACSSTAECELCGDDANLKSVQVPLMGKMEICNDCNKEIKEIGNAFN
jgi:hypothetical protein